MTAGPTSCRQRSRWLLVGAAALTLIVPARASDCCSCEDEAKALWLLNCARLIEWPEQSFTNAQSPFVVGLLGQDFGEQMDRVFDGKVVQGRAFVVKRLSPKQDLNVCHILFISASERKQTGAVLARLKSAPVLTVGETDDFLDRGGMMQFLPRRDTIGFAVNLEPAQSSRLHLNASLLKVAVSVRGRYE